MGRFLNELAAKVHSVPFGEQPLEVLVDFSYQCNSGEIITAKAGFRSDAATVPRFLWRVIPPMGRYTWAAVIHDVLCVEKTMSSEKAAKIFNECMIKLGVPSFKRKLMYRAVNKLGPKF